MMRRQIGFTLLEVLLSISISATLLLAGAGLFTYSNMARAKAATIEEVDKQSDFVARTVMQSLRNSYGIAWPQYQESSSLLEVGSYTAANDQTVFRLASGKITMQAGAAAAVDLTSSDIVVSAFTVTNTSSLGSPGSVRVVLTLDYAGSGTSGYSYQKTVRFSGSARQP